MALSAYAGALLRNCFTLTKDCSCCCAALDLYCAGEPPTITVFGKTFTLDTFAAPTVNSIPYWSASGELVSDNVKLVNAALPRYYGFCAAGESNLVTPVQNDDVACSFRYLLRDGFVSINMVAVEYEDNTLTVAKKTSQFTVREDGTYWGSDFSERFVAVGGHTWAAMAAYNPSPYTTPSEIYPPEGATQWEFSDGAPANCLP